MNGLLAEVRTKWQYHRQSLLRSDFNHADEELARLMYFANEHPIITGILKHLRENDSYKALDEIDWIKKHDQRAMTRLGFSLDETERCAQSLKMIDWIDTQFENTANASTPGGLLAVGRAVYIGSSTKIIDYIHSAIENIFDPLYFYIDAELRNLETLITPADIISEIQSLVNTEASVRYPETHALLTDTYKQLFTLTVDSSGSSWNQIGFSCRTILTKFANEVFNSSYVPDGQEQPKKDDASNKLKWTTRYFLKSLASGDHYRESIEKIIQANWDFVASVGHRQQSALAKDARLAVIYTYLTISILDNLIGD